MYRLDNSEKRLEKLELTTFKAKNLGERNDLQEWIASDPSVLGEDLLIIQKEFAGFDNTKERLDLLALDRKGNLVVIENKLDDSGRNVTWQALKYASYCSRLTREDIREIFQQYLTANRRSEPAERLLGDFLDPDGLGGAEMNEGFSQRIILVARSFRREVTSTVMWLLNFGVRLQCVKVTPYLLNDELIVRFEKIIPVRDAEEFLIGIAIKNQDDLEARERLNQRNELAYRFWEYSLPSLQAKGMYENLSPPRAPWIDMPSGARGVTYNLVTNSRGSRLELYINRSSQVENKAVFDLLHRHRGEIEASFNEPLIWERLKERNPSRVRLDSELRLEDEERWGAISDFFVDGMGRLQRAVGPFLEEASKRVP